MIRWTCLNLISDNIFIYFHNQLSNGQDTVFTKTDMLDLRHLILSLKGIDDKNYSLKDINSRTLLIVFICNHCPYVKARISDLISLQSKFDISDLQIIGINSNDPSYEGEGFDNMVKFAQEYSLNFPYLIDETQRVARRLRSGVYPRSISI